jgi:predicted dehydrogenase
MARIKVGMLGVGHSHAAGKMEVFRASDDYEVVGVVEPDAALARAAQNSASFKDLPFISRDQLLNTPGLALVVVETNVPGILDAAEAVIEAGKHLHLEKPGGASLPRFRRLIETATRKHLAVQLGYMYRYSPAIVFLRHALAEGWLGSPFELSAVMSKVVSPASRRELATFSGGMMFELGSHLLDLVVGILGKPTGVTPYAQHISLAEDGLADNTLAVLTYPKALATVKSSAQEIDGGDRRHLVVCGTEGTIHVQPLDKPSVRLTLSKSRDKYRKGTTEIPFGDFPRYAGDVADLARIIRGEKDSDFPYSHELAVMETVLRASGMPIDK